MTVKANSRLDLGELHSLLLKACPREGYDTCSIRGSLAPALGVSYQYIYRWVKEGRVPPKYVKPIVALSEGRVSVDCLVPFVI